MKKNPLVDARVPRIIIPSPDPRGCNDGAPGPSSSHSSSLRGTVVRGVV